MNLVFLPLSLSLAFFFPGFAVAVRLRVRAPAAAGFIISSVMLFESLLFLQVTGIGLTFRSVFAALAVLNLVVVSLCFRNFEVNLPDSWKLPRPRGLLEVFLVIPVVLSTLLLTFRAVLQPLNGYDTSIRWSLLAEEIFAAGHFNFYPPLAAADFRHVFFVDSIPPMCQFSYFWLYASLGKVQHQWTALSVILQYLLIFYFCFRLTEEIAGRTAAFFAVATLSTSVIFFWSVVMGQETGLTALSVVATFYFILSAETTNARGAMIAAACATALGVLSREYGWVILVCGLAAVASRKFDRFHVGLYAGTVVLLAVPWYLRTWILTGNPFYSNPIGGLFAVNEIYSRILEFQGTVLSLTVEPLEKLKVLGFLVKSKSLLVVPAGLVGLWVLRRQYWLHLSLVIYGLTWAYSVAHTGGGLYYSTRVLSPVFVLLAVASGAFLARLMTRDRLVRGAVVLVVGLIAVVALLQEVIVPGHLETVHSKDWYLQAFSSENPNAWVIPLFEGVPAGSRCLSDWGGAWVEARKAGIEIVPLWSPDALAAFDRDASPEAIIEALRERDINWVLAAQILNLDFLRTNSPLYRSLMQTVPWRVSPSGKFALFFLGNGIPDWGNGEKPMAGQTERPTPGR